MFDMVLNMPLQRSYQCPYFSYCSLFDIYCYWPCLYMSAFRNLVNLDLSGVFPTCSRFNIIKRISLQYSSSSEKKKGIVRQTKGPVREKKTKQQMNIPCKHIIAGNYLKKYESLYWFHWNKKCFFRSQCNKRCNNQQLIPSR